MYLRLDTCQDIVGHRESDFDFCRYRSYLFPYLNNLPFRTLFSDPVASPSAVAYVSTLDSDIDCCRWQVADLLHLRCAALNCYNATLHQTPWFLPEIGEEC